MTATENPNGVIKLSPTIYRLVYWTHYLQHAKIFRNGIMYKTILILILILQYTSIGSLIWCVHRLHVTGHSTIFKFDMRELGARAEGTAVSPPLWLRPCSAI